MNDRTNPRHAHAAAERSGIDDRSPAAEPGVAKRSAHDRTNPTKAGAGERSAGHNRTNPQTPAGRRTAKRSADDRTNPSAATKQAVPERRAKNSRTNPKAGTTASAATRSAHDRANRTKAAAAERTAGHDRTNPSAEAQGGRAKRSALKDRKNPKPAAKPGAAERSVVDDRANRKSTAQAGAARRPTDYRTNPNAGTPARLHYDDAYIKGILQRVKTIAAVGMSANDMRPSYFAMLYLQQKGYRMIPVNPRYAGREILGETVVASLNDLPAPPDMVQIFRKAEEAPAVVDEAIRASAKVVWLQLGIRSDEAAERARAAGLDVVMDRCPKIEYGRLFGEIGWAGVNRRVISAKKGQALQLSHRKGGLAWRPAPRR
jgi:predicted CoA-binding protein